VYQRKTKGMIAIGAELPATYGPGNRGSDGGSGTPLANSGELTTNGWEIGIDFRHRFSNGLGLSVMASISDALSTITKHPNGLNTSLSNTNYQGRIWGEIWGFETVGFFTEEDFARDADGDRIFYSYVDGERVYGKSGRHAVMAPGVASQEWVEQGAGWFTTQPGDIRYKDLVGDGVINRGDYTAANPGSMRRIGNTTPRYEYSTRISLDYKGIDFSMFLQGVGKRDFWGTGTMMIPGWNSSEMVFFTHQTDYWTPENPNAFYPRLTPIVASVQPTVNTGAAALNFIPQTKYLLNMAYLRVKNVTVGYSLPATLVQRVGIENLRIFVSGENLFTFHRLGDIPLDPETGIASGDGGTMGFGRVYPFTRSFACGLQLRF
jgi:hypothetical protein